MKRFSAVAAGSRTWKPRRRGLALLGIVLVLAGGISVAALGALSVNAGTVVAGKDYKVALLLPGRKNDGGFSQLGYIGLQLTAKKYKVKTAVAENVPTATQNDAYRNFASQGYDLVVGWGGQYNDGAKAVAPDFPNTKFSVFFGFGDATNNFIPYNEREHQWSFILGYAAALASKTNHVGVIIGPCFPLSAEEAYGYRFGARYAKKNIKVSMVSLNSFDDPGAAREASNAMIAAGADGITGQLNTGNRGIQAAARQHPGVLALIENAVDFKKLEAPDVTFTSAGGVKYASLVLIQNLTRLLIAGKLGGKTLLVPFPVHKNYQGIAPFPAKPKAILRQRGVDPQGLFKKLVAMQNAIASGKVKVPDKTNCPLK